MRGAKTFWAARAGVAAIEFAIMAPVLLALVAGITEIGRALVVFDSVNRIAAQYAAAWSSCSDSSGSCNTELASYYPTATIGNIAPRLNPASLTLEMLWVSMNGATPTVVYSYPSGKTAANMSAAETSASASIPSGQVGVVVSATYTFTPQYFPGPMAGILGASLTSSYVVAQTVKN